jgi:hypothetical protein
MAQGEAQTHQSADHAARNARDGDPVTKGAYTPDHPLLELQHTAGNRAVQRLIDGDAPGSGRPALVQRHMAPGMAGMAMSSQATVQSTAGSLMMQGAQTTIAGIQVQQAAGQLMQSASMIAAAVASSESLPAAATGGATPEPIQVPATGGV